MMRLRWLDRTTLSVQMEELLPQTIIGMSPDEVFRLPLWVGNRRVPVGELFEVTSTDEECLTIEGDLRHLNGIGRKMATGSLVVRGNAGAHLGSGMSGGMIEVFGNVAEYAGSEMRGGFLKIAGSAGFGLGAAYDGSRIGMREGVILVQGATGDDAGFKMRRGLIAVVGDVGSGFGRSMIAGSLFTFGKVGHFAGLGMKRGTIGLLGSGEPDLFPCFESTGCYRFPFLSIYLRRLATWGLPVSAEMFDTKFARYNGDLSEGGRGEILIANSGH